MEFNKRISLFQRMLFNGYTRGDKIFEKDWYDEAAELALEIKMKKTPVIIGKTISDYLKRTFEDDTVTDFEELGFKMAEIINLKLD